MAKHISRATRFGEALGKVSDAKVEIESLRDELQDWYDNLPENFQSGDKGGQFLMKHNPRHRYDCGHCKFNWCCGYTCSCHLNLPDPPTWLSEVLKRIHKLVHESFIHKLKTKNQ